MVKKETEIEDGTFRAAVYVRMSTEHQQYSTHNQQDKIEAYARSRSIDIVQIYADEGKSGLRIDGRAALQRLISDVETGKANFNVILVYDVSRWGRFQDADESAYYEYICRRAGIQVTYCAEQFENDGSPVSTIVKGVKRAMAGEYSRELSSKVFAGQCRLIEMGYRQGGPAGFGLRRVLIDQSGVSKGTLTRGQHKSLQTDRVILRPGPPEEVEVVDRIYRWFIDDGLQESTIAARLNREGILTDLDRPWTRGTVHEVLTNEKYVGDNVFNRTSFKLKKQFVVNTPDMWIRKEGAFEAVVDRAIFYTAQGIIRARFRRFTDDELLERLKNLYQQRGLLSGLVINETDGMPSSSVYAHRFGSLIRAYQLIGFQPERDYKYLEINRFLRKLHPDVLQATKGNIEAMNGRVKWDERTDLLHVNNEFTASIVLARCQQLESGRRFWKVRLDTSLNPDISVVVRLSPRNEEALDYYLLPRLDFGTSGIRLAEQNAMELESYRFDTLDYFYGMGAQTKLRRVA
ncbi:serine recombinase [Hydrogenophaga sp. Root209]|uniref:recombinase family protein n=1 Tax=Hydrogenophaga sp. Root209 TaxID=1736490 RepID=UPI0006F213C8|nr:recombinase family protein [Hydrogenophaga sp. Root209]KRC03846.1 serine recombinase [Hydrogenophaga sp. Root209]